MEELTFEEIEQSVVKEIEAAQTYSGNRAGQREKSWDRYYGKKLGNEVKGRSQFITRDLLETIESILPFLIKLFASGDAKIDIEIEGQETWVGKALMSEIQKNLGRSTPNLFSLFYQWFKDALISDTAFVKLSWDLDIETVNIEYDELPGANLQQLIDDPDVELKDSGEASVTPEGIIFANVSAEIKKKIKDALYAESTPHWEFLVDPKSRSMNDEYSKGQKTEVSVDYLKRINRARGGDYFQNLDRLESGESKAETNTAESEKANYMDDQTETDMETEKGPRSPVSFVEWYTRLDVDGDGYLEDIVCFIGNGHLLAWGENQEEFIPFAALSPIIDCYKFYGISYADLLIEVQNLKTMLLRRILDNFDFQNSGRWLKDPNSGIDTAALLNNIPGGVITGRVEGLKDLTPPAFNPASLSILEYVDTIKENRTGVTRYNQGSDANSLNKTARGISMIQSASMQRMELIARIFAEGGIKDFYRKAALLYQKYLKKPFTTKVFGKERQVTPEMLQGEISTTVNMGVVASVGAEEAQRIEHMLGVLFQVNGAFPGIMTPESVHNLMKRYITASGFKNADDFIGDVEDYLQKMQQQQEQQSKMQQEMMQMQQKMQEMELSIKGQDSQTKAKKVDVDADIAKAKLAQEDKSDMAEITQDEKESKREYRLGLLELLVKGNQDQVRSKV